MEEYAAHKKADSMMTEEKFFILTGLQEPVDNCENITSKINEALQTKQIQACVKSIYIVFTSAEAGLCGFDNECLLGLARITGVDAKKLESLEITGTNTRLQNLPQNVFGETTVKIQHHIFNLIPSLRKELVLLCKKLGIRITTEGHNLWLTGEALQITLANYHLNHLNLKSHMEWEFGPGNTTQDGKNLSDFMSMSPSKHSTTCANYPTVYLYLMLFLDRAPTRSGIKTIFVVPQDNCYDATLVLERESRILESVRMDPTAKYKADLNDIMQTLKKAYKLIYLAEPMQSDFRQMLENILEQMYKPLFFLKCRNRHWSCYVFEKDEASAPRKFVDDYLKVNTSKTVNTLWSELPKDIFVTKRPHLMVAEPEKEPIGKHFKEIPLGDKSRESGKHTSQTYEEEEKKKPDLPKKPSKMEHTMKSKVSWQHVQYLFANQSKQLKDLETKHNVQVSYDKEGVLIHSASEEVAKKAEVQLNNMLKSANLKSMELLDCIPLQCAAKGSVIVNCMGDVVLATGPKNLTEAFQKALKTCIKDISQKRETEETQTTYIDNKSRLIQSQVTGSVPSEKENRLQDGSMIGERTKDAANTPPTTPGEGSTGSDTFGYPVDGTKSLDRGGKGKRKGLKTSATKTTGDKQALKTITKTTGIEGMTTYENESTRILVQVGIGDITQLQVDAIVNAANDELDHISGVARAIKEAAGPEFDEECREVLKRRRHKLETGDVCVTSGGQMPAKMVLHAVGPAMDDYDDESEAYEMLQKTFKQSLYTAKKNSCKSVAIPAISSGAFGIPMGTVAKMACAALQDFIEAEDTEPIRLVIFTDVRPEMIECFQKRMKKLVRNNVLKLSA